MMGRRIFLIIFYFCMTSNSLLFFSQQVFGQETKKTIKLETVGFFDFLVGSSTDYVKSGVDLCKDKSWFSNTSEYKIKGNIFSVAKSGLS